MTANLQANRQRLASQVQEAASSDQHLKLLEIYEEQLRDFLANDNKLSFLKTRSSDLSTLLANIELAAEDLDDGDGSADYKALKAHAKNQ